MALVVIDRIHDRLQLYVPYRRVDKPAKRHFWLQLLYHSYGKVLFGHNSFSNNCIRMTMQQILPIGLPFSKRNYRLSIVASKSEG